MVSAFDSALLGGLYSDPDLADLFSDTAELAAMLQVESALAQAQADLGIVPQPAADAIADACRHPPEPAALGDAAAAAGVPVPALVADLRRRLRGGPGADWLHWGATSQDIADTGLVLRLRAALPILSARCADLLAALAAQAGAHRALPMAARTRSQIATTTTFGARVASWGAPFLRHRDRLGALEPRLLTVSFAGASGTLSALGGDGPAVADALADRLNLSRQRLPWHTTRDTIAELAGVCASLSGSTAKMARDLLLLGQSELREVAIGAGGGSSTMPHKSNPVRAEAVVTLAKVAAANASLIVDAQIHENDRDGVAWGLEWHALPQIVVATGRALALAAGLARDMRPDPDRMAHTIAATGGLMMAEAASLALTPHLGRETAQALVKSACLTAADTGQDLRAALATATDAPVDWQAVFDPANATGFAAGFADRFVADVAAVTA